VEFDEKMYVVIYRVEHQNVYMCVMCVYNLLMISLFSYYFLNMGMCFFMFFFVLPLTGAQSNHSENGACRWAFPRLCACGASKVSRSYLSKVHTQFEQKTPKFI